MGDATVEEMFDEACDDAVDRQRDRGWDAYRCSECIAERGSEVSGMSNGFIRDNDYCDFRRREDSGERRTPRKGDKNTKTMGNEEKIIDE